jgi:hypothetical protein
LGRIAGKIARQRNDVVLTRKFCDFGGEDQVLHDLREKLASPRCAAARDGFGAARQTLHPRGTAIVVGMAIQFLVLANSAVSAALI